MAGLLEWLSNQKDSAANDYADLMSNYPNAQKFGKGLIKAISEHVPSNEDFKSPEAMRDWGTAAALNAPMGLTFIGKNAANWNPVKAAEAEKLLNAGVDPVQVWKEHLIGRMPDKSLFSEIDDSLAMTTPQSEWPSIQRNQLNYGKDAFGPLSNFLSHSQLKENYPEILGSKYSDPQVSLKIQAQNAGGSFDNDGTIIAGMTQPYSKASEINKSTLFHELQHAIQDREGWARGGSQSGYQSTIGVIDDLKQQLPLLKKEKNQLLDNFLNTYDESLQPKMQDLDRKILKYEDIIKNPDQNLSNMDELSRQYYKRLTGEAQARATQDRMNMNMQQRRDTYPLAGGKLSDIPLDQLINRYR